ncbi:uncharacterized protein RAG0_06284 [Rhynchosporium agropyri]|uniref:Uncharacterized protein n=1 Tax=Rhynchosporium agropyri TaxID=914238 RepID=A0A1E1KGH1_9HELO|nr:uncharacterized protein RAG0_06284 [Rhynchosporium agropyri]
MYLESFEQRDLMLGKKDMNLFYDMLHKDIRHCLEWKRLRVEILDIIRHGNICQEVGVLNQCWDAD